jgi:hypothetical protein
MLFIKLGRKGLYLLVKVFYLRPNKTQGVLLGRRLQNALRFGEEKKVKSKKS